jgi:hypothetical protein
VLAPVFSFCRMKRNDTKSILVDIRLPRRQLNSFVQLCDPGARCTSKRWVRNDTYHAQIYAGNHRTRICLEHADTVPHTVTELQALKSQR